MVSFLNGPWVSLHINIQEVVAVGNIIPVHPIRYLRMGDGAVGYRLRRYASEFPHLLQEVGYVEKEAGPLREITKGFGGRLFASDTEAFDRMKAAGNEPLGTLEDALKLPVDFIVDCTDSQIYYRAILPKLGVTTPVIGQGSLDAKGGDVFKISLSSLVNLSMVEEKKLMDQPGGIRKVSCNTTAASRAIQALRGAYGLKYGPFVKHYEIELFRRTAEQGQKGQNDDVTFIADSHRQHHYRDIDMVFENTDHTGASPKNQPTIGKSYAKQGCHTRGHIQDIRVYLSGTPCIDKNSEKRPETEIARIFEESPRIFVAKGIDGLAKAINHFARLGRFMGDFPENVIVGESIEYDPATNSVRFTQIVDNVSIVVPENIDILLKLGTGKPAGEVIKMVDQTLALGVLPGFFRPGAIYRKHYR